MSVLAVAVVGRDAERLSATAQTIAAAGGDVLAVQADLTTGDLTAVVAQVMGHYGRIDALVHAAGQYEAQVFGQPGVDGTEAVDRLWAINARVPFRLGELALPHMTEGGSIVFVSAAIARHGLAGGAGYAMTKGALESLTRVLAVELAPRGIRVNAVCPGLIATDMTAWARESEKVGDAILAVTLAGRWGAPEEIGAAVGFLVSDAAGYVQGSVLDVTGGFPTPRFAL